MTTDHGQLYKVVVTQDFGPEVMTFLRQQPQLNLVIWSIPGACDRRWLLDNIPEAEGLLVTRTDRVDEDMLEKGATCNMLHVVAALTTFSAGTSLRVISTMSAGYEHLPLSALAKRGIKLGYTPDIPNDAVADLSVMLALMAGRNGGETLTLVKEGQWPNFTWSPFGFCGPQLSPTLSSPTKKVGFLGFGRIAQTTLMRLIPFGITHCLYTGNPKSPPNTSLESSLVQRYRAINPKFETIKQVDLDELAKDSDVLFVLAPGGKETEHIINEELLRKMKPTSVLVNTSRGSLVDSYALAKALKERWIWGAGLDVVEGEINIPSDHPLVKEPRCVVVPHIGTATLETRLGMAMMAAENVVAGVVGTLMPAELDLHGWL